MLITTAALQGQHPFQKIKLYSTTMARTKFSRPLNNAVLVHSESKAILAENPPHFRLYCNGWYVAVGDNIYSISSMGKVDGKHAWCATRQGQSMDFVIGEVMQSMGTNPSKTSSYLLHRARICMAGITVKFPSAKIEACQVESRMMVSLFQSGAEAAVGVLPKEGIFPFYKAYMKAHMCSNIFSQQTYTVASLSGEIELISTVLDMFDGTPPKDMWFSMQMFPHFMMRKVNALWLSCGFKLTIEEKRRHNYAACMSKVLVLCLYEFSVILNNIHCSRAPAIEIPASPTDNTCIATVPWAPRKERVRDTGDGVYPPRVLDFDEAAAEPKSPGTPECVIVKKTGTDVTGAASASPVSKGVIRHAETAPDPRASKRAKSTA
jgi:hypothetical protein